MFRKITSLFLAVVMAVSLNGIPAAMAESSVVPDGKVAALLESAAANGLLTGIAGEVKPEDDLTRAQMASILNSAFGAAEQAPLSGFTDVDEGAWYYADMAKAVQMGAFTEDGTTLNPEGTITREEAFLALSRVFKLQAGDTAVLNGLKDKDSITPGALDAAAALLKAGYIAAEDGYLNPKAGTTLAEFLQILNGMVKSYLNREGTYTSVPDGSVMINVPDVTLKDVVIKGDLILGDGVGDGSVTLDSVTVTGRTLVRGGGAHSIRITGTSSLQSIVIARVNGELRVFAEDGTEIGEVFVDGRDDVTMEGDFASVTLAADSVTVTAVNAQIGSAQIAGENSRIIVAAGSAVNTLTVDGANAAVEVSGTVTDVVVNGGGALISGEGQVDSVEANANNVVVTTPDTFVTAAAGTSGVTAGTRDVPEGTTVNTTPEYDGGAGGDKPVVTSVSPAQGPASGGTAVTVKGRYFTDATAVTFGGKAAASYKVVSSTEITAVTPAGAPGAVIVAVTTDYGTGTKASSYTYVAAPVIASVHPNAGPKAGGTAVTITGTGFTGATSVTFGGTAAASYTVISDTQITVVTPAGAKGPADVTVTAPGGTVTKSSAYSYIPIPSITSIGPSSGPLTGGGTVIITGSGFTGATSVTFGGAAASYTVVSDTSITVVLPAGAAGPADVAITTPGGTKTQAAAFNYSPVPSITSVSPTAGPVSGGTTVTITGSGFIGTDLVTFGGRAAVSYTVNSDASITAVTPWGDAGPADVTVTTAGGTGAKTAAYTYAAAPSITSVSPNAGPAAGGTAVTITGTGFAGATSVTFGGAAAASYTVVSGTQITAVTPAGPAGLADIAVVTAGGTAVKASSYTYIPAPVTASVSPNTGRVLGDTAVTITGSGFLGATAVAFNGADAYSFTVVSDTCITANTPPGAAGAADITVTTPGGTGTAAALYTYFPAPFITSVSPNIGPMSGGAPVTISGTGFASTTSVRFGGTPTTSFTVVSDTVISAMTPPGLPESVDVAVSTPYGTFIATGWYTYVMPPWVITVSPSFGPVAGGNTVNIPGFRFSGATAVTFGTTPATSFTVVSDTQITATAPAGPAGTVDVTVTAAGGTSVSVPYQYIAPPAIAFLSPSTGPAAGGTMVNITGTGFAGATAVTFGGIPSSSFTVVSDTSIMVALPAGTAGPADVAVTAVGGTGTASAAFTYLPAPSVSSVSPNVGPVTGGATVTISGSGFTGATLVLFGLAPATSFTVVSDSMIIAVTPSGTLGASDVTVTAPGGTGVKTGGYTFVLPPMAITLLPASGPISGGTAVVITGFSLTGATAVNFGLTPAVSFTVNSDSQITAIAPAGLAGATLVTVTTPGGTTLPLSYQYALPPAITSVSPDMGPLSGGNTVTITGSNFTEATAVFFGGNPAIAFTVVSDTSIMVVTPAGIAGTVDVTVTTVTSVTGTASGAYTYVPAPSITSVSPNAGPVTGGSTVIINGTGFSGTTSVIFGVAPATSFTVVSNTQITATTPAGTDTVSATVTTAGGTSNMVPYTYMPAPAAASVSPSIGPEAGGNTVTITGTNLTGAITVLFGGTPAASFTVNSGTQITAVAPAGTGTVLVTIMTTGGTSNGILYTYVPAPVITTIVPNAGPVTGGNTITITGTGYTGATSVNFGAIPATSFTVVSDTEITASAPAGTGTVLVTVTTIGGTSNGVAYTYVPASVITAIVPSAGPVTGGNTVTITGTGFTWAASVNFGATPATSFTVVSDTQITAVAPAGTGIVSVTVMTAGGTSNGISYTYVPAPVISTIVPNAGSVTGGSTVTITGTGYTGDVSVNFGAAPATSFTVVSDTQITAIAPAGTGAVQVTVTTVGGTSNGVAYTYIPEPVITSIAPNADLESGGTTVVITGQHFSEVTAVNFGAAPAFSFTVNSDTQITAISPAGTAAGPVDVTVTNMYATATKTGAFTYVTQPNITSVSSDNGSLSGGNTLTIEGENLTWVNSVSFGGTAAASFTVNSDTSITVTVPAGTEPGPVDITVSSYGFESTLVSSYNYMALTISYVDSNMGPAEGSGNSVSIYGFCFTGAISVTFGGTPAVSFFVSEDRWIVAVPPAGTGTVTVTVTTPNGTATKAEAYTYVTTPTINSVSPNSRPMAGGNEVTITGTNLTQTASVSFGGIAAASFTVNSATSITAIAPAHAAGIVDVVVTTAYGTATKAGAYTYILLPPTIISVSPSSGLEAGGTPVTITGTDFTGVTAVSFGTTTETSFTVNSSTSITVIAPAHAAGIVDVFVVAAGGVASGTYTYLPPPTITAVSPDEGSEAGGTPVTITGTGFDSVSSVKFDGTLSAFTVNSGTQITATVPAGAAGSADVMVTTPGGTATAVGAYTYIPAPSITSISPDEGPEPGGGTVTIAGTGFTGATAVAFGGTAATFSVDSDTQITATAPAGTAGLVDVKVTTPYGSDTKTDAYTYFPVPTITAVSSGEGSEAGGSPVTITGTGFYSVSSVKFGGTISAFTVDSDTQITAIVPARAAGQVDITVTTPGGTATAAGAYTYFPVPAITLVDPGEGPAAGGNQVTITGIGFVSVLSVKFGGAISAFTVDSDTQITATAPAGAAGPADVTVTTEYGTTTVAGAYTYIDD